MNRRRQLFAMVTFFLGVWTSFVGFASDSDFGLSKRLPWTTSRVTGSPEPPPPLRTRQAFPNIHFEHPVVISPAAGTHRWFVGEQAGKIFSFPKDSKAKSPDLFLDTKKLVDREIERGGTDAKRFEAVYGLTFHPRFAENRYCYVCYVVAGEGSKQLENGTRVSRFRVSDDDPPVCDPQSEQILITWMQGGHNGGCLQFGPDGYLYISTGDAGPAFPPDEHKAGQDVSNLLSSVIRIDVDRQDDGRHYSIPKDNPFVQLSGARGEVWCYGLRNPWKMSFDKVTGDLWIGDVGWELWELVFRAEKGGNYGWSITEGRQPVHPDRKVGPTPITPPTIDIPHSDGVSITGGHVYRGSKFPELVGHYIFGDWETRRIWASRWDPIHRVAEERRDIVDPTVRLVAFGEDFDGELVMLDYDDGFVYEFERNPTAGKNSDFPKKLSETGLFDDVAKQRPAEGVLPFAVNVEQWSDYAVAERFVAVPGTGRIRLNQQDRTIAGSMFGSSMSFPKDSVLVKTLSLELEHGVENSRRRIETQMLHFDGKFWRPYSYRWNAEQTDADLVESNGDQTIVTVKEDAAPGGRREQTWRFSSRVECSRCHNQWAEHALAFNVRQLNREVDYHGTLDNQLRALEHAEWIQLDKSPSETKAVTDEQNKNAQREAYERAFPKLTNPYDSKLTLEERARSYLHVNCAHCHRNGGGGTAYIELQKELSIDALKAIDVRPTQGSFEIADARILAPGDPYRSTMFYRVSKTGAGRMPHIGSELVDLRGVELLHDWIRQLPSHSKDDQKVAKLKSLAPTGKTKANSSKDAKAREQDELRAKERQELVTDLLTSTSRALVLVRAIQRGDLPDAIRDEVAGIAAESSQPAVRDLFDQFLPPERRPQRLGNVVRAADILSRDGDRERGRKLFAQNETVQCKKCHRIGDVGSTLGPELTQIGKKYDRRQILENILEPSKVIEPKYVSYLVTTDSGKRVVGFVISKDDQELRIRDALNQEVRIPVSEVEEITPQRNSLMPDLLVRDLTAEQLADLLEYLSNLK